MRENEPNADGAKGTIIFTNASAALKGLVKTKGLPTLNRLTRPGA